MSFRARFAFVINYTSGSSTISSYKLDVNTGALTSSGGAALSVGEEPAGIAVHPTGRFVYCIDSEAQKLFGFTVNTGIGADAGQLTEINDYPIEMVSPSSITIDPSGRFLYVTSRSENKVYLFTINSSTGVLTVTGNYDTESNPCSVIADYSGKYIYVANQNSNNITAYSISFGTGVLTKINTTNSVAGRSPDYLRPSPNGKFIYAVNTGNNSISCYEIGTNGALTEISGSPYTQAGVTDVRQMAISPKGNFLFVVDFMQSQLIGFSVNQQTGELLSIAGSPFSVGQWDSAVCFDPTGEYIFNTNSSNNSVSVFSVNQETGVIDSIGNASPSGSNPQHIAVAAPSNLLLTNSGKTSSPSITFLSQDPRNGVLDTFTIGPIRVDLAPDPGIVSPDKKFAYLINEGDNKISAFVINPRIGSIEEIPGSPFTSEGNSPHNACFTPNGNFLYVNNYIDNTISCYSIDDSTGTITHTSTTKSLFLYITCLKVHPNGEYLYAGSSTNLIFVFSIGSDGSLTKVTGSPVTTGKSPYDFAFSKDGNEVYVALSGTTSYEGEGIVGSSVSAYTVDTNGLLTEINGSPFSTGDDGISPQSITIDYISNFLYTANYKSNNISVFSINTDTGALEKIGANIPSGSTSQTSSGPKNILVDKAGTYVYVGNADTNSIAVFTTNNDGSLTPVNGSPFKDQMSVDFLDLLEW